MASVAAPPLDSDRCRRSSTLPSLLPFLSPKVSPFPLSRICVPVRLPSSLSLLAPPSDCTCCDPASLPGPTQKQNLSSLPSGSGVGFPSKVRVAGPRTDGKGGGPAFVGQVFSMCDLSGTGLMAVSTHFDIPFISKRTPKWLKKMFAAITRSERNRPVFRFFLDLGDAVTYVKRLNIPSGVVGACPLDLAYEHFQKKPELFQFVPNEKQVKAANKLLKTVPHNGGSRKIDGVPVFSAQNLDIAIASTDGIKWYTPYFFDKSMLDKILEESVDQHFQTLIQTRHMQRRRDVIDDNLAADMIEEMGDSLWEPPEVQELLDEMGQPAIPLSVISKAVGMQLLYAVDRVLLGNRWLRKATGIQPKFPYVVDSFERRSAASLLRASELANCLDSSEGEHSKGYRQYPNQKFHGSHQVKQREAFDLRLPFADWFNQLLSKPHSGLQNQPDARVESSSQEHIKQSLPPNPFLPKITMVGISMSEGGHISKASLKKTMEDLTRDLEQTDRSHPFSSDINIPKTEDKDPLFVANVGEYYSGMSKTGSSRWVRGLNS